MTTRDPTAALLIIGAEVLSGKVRDENGPYLIGALRERGVGVVEMRTIGDDVDEIAAATRALSVGASYVFTTGGIGPTHDDVTIAGIAAAFDTEIVQFTDLVERWRQRLGEEPSPAHRKMAEVPAGARVILDERSFVPIVQLHNVTVLPGVPSLVRICFERIGDQFRGRPFVSRALLLNTGESQIAAHLTDVQARFPEIAIGSYPRFDKGAPYHVKVTVDGRDEAMVARVTDELRAGMPQGALLSIE